MKTIMVCINSTVNVKQNQVQYECDPSISHVSV